MKLVEPALADCDLAFHERTGEVDVRTDERERERDYNALASQQV